MDPIIAFYTHQGTDHKGRTLKQIWNFSDIELEKTHDYIQWLFPTHIESRFNSNAPILTEEVIHEFVESKEASVNLIVSSFIFERFLRLNDDVPFWVKKSGGGDNHNCLRISRVIASLNLLRQEERVCDFYKSILEVYIKNNPSPIYHWEHANFQFSTYHYKYELANMFVNYIESLDK